MSPTPEVETFIRANLPAPPARILEVGAGDGGLARGLTSGGYDVLAIDPASDAANVHRVPLGELAERPRSFEAAVAVVSLHHVDPLEASCRRLAEVLRPGAPLVVDELDVGRFDAVAASWWLEQRRALGLRTDEPSETPEEMVTEVRAHLHPLARIVAALTPSFDVGAPLRGVYLYRWKLDNALRHDEEALVARGMLPAVGARFVAIRRPA